MPKQRKIAIYSGTVPSTTFIERLIDGFSCTDNKIYLFGTLKGGSSKYFKNIVLVTYRNSKVSKALHLIKYSLLLSMFKPNDKRQLDKWSMQNHKGSKRHRLKYYPVLWHRPDIFHLQWAKGIEDWSWVKDFGIKLVLSLRGAHINYSPIANEDLAKTYKKLFPEVDGFHAVSKNIALEAQIYGADPERIKVVYSGLDLHNEDGKSENMNESDVYHMLSVGRSHWVKGYSYALDACKQLKRSNFRFKYTIIGGLNDIELLYQVKDLGLTSEVELLDKTSFNEVKHYMKHTDLLLLPSLKEGLANVVLEAMSLKTLVLSTDCGGMNEVIVDGVNGFLTPIRDANTMAAKIIEIASIDQGQIEKIQQNALRTINDQHSHTKMIEGMLELYKVLED